MKKTAAFILSIALFLSCTANAHGAAKVAALMYHSVTHDVNRVNNYTATPEQLESDIRFFQACGYITMTASELAEEDMANIDNLKILLLTFDDGYDNFYTEVFPILQRTGAKATMFLIGSYINRYGYLNEEQVCEMAHSGLVEIGSHTGAIHNIPVNLLRDIYNNPEVQNDVIEDIRRNGELLTGVTGKEIKSLSWPYGYYTAALDTAVKNNLGYKISFGTEFGVNFFTGDISVPLNRMNRDGRDTSKWVFDRANVQFYGK